MIVLELDILSELGECEKIGEPKTLEMKNDDKPQSTTISSGGFYGNKIGPPQEKPREQSLPSKPNSSSHGTIYPIEALSPYAHKWTIKARCTSKSEVKTWHNKNGEGKLFSVNLLDESGEIRATCWKEQCDAFYDVFQEGNVYYITAPCRVQLARKQFSNINNDYELTFETGTLVEKVGQDNPLNHRVHPAYYMFRQRSGMTSLKYASNSPIFRTFRRSRRTQQSTLLESSRRLEKPIKLSPRAPTSHTINVT